MACLHNKAREIVSQLATSFPPPRPQIKCLAGTGSPADSCLVSGVVLRKGVALRKMRSHVPNPTVLLLRGSLEYHGGAGGLTSLERVTMEQVGWWAWKKGVKVGRPFYSP